MQIYNNLCLKCKESTPNKLSNLNINRGVRLRCLKCQVETKYIKITKLKEWEFKNAAK